MSSRGRYRGVALVALATALTLTACTTDSQPAPPTPSPTQAAYSAEQDAYSPITVDVTNDPVPVKATDGRIHMAYELLITNATSGDVTIESVDAVAGSSTLQSLSGDQLPALFRTIGTGGSAPVLAGGQRGMVWMDAVVDTEADVPLSIDHVITVRAAEAHPPVFDTVTEVRAPRVPVDSTPAVRIGPPLSGPNWLDANGCCELTPHRAAVSPINGAFNVPERWAIDYVQLTDTNALFNGDPASLDSYPSYGRDILAVADGPIVAMTTDRPEQVPGTAPTGLTLDEYGGNYIVQDIGGGRFAFYAHLQPDNPQGLAIGQTLRRGDVIGLLGNTGNSDAPHLHFHVMSSPSPLASNGLPFVIDGFTLQGEVPTADDLDKAYDGTPYPIDTAHAGERTDEAPLVRTLMSYE
ncbi:M23 family metallopeptidase [Compostimonas suwonensis]|uniref:Peptidase M23-like protein n=1 Tax=Compostimonas suwonensis TaxID=1048394 RepID=A0A2M9C4V3_9MICO|nr:M23 family metallopeptidase [Compostimonas suwonensis]PJJ65546.1 peptidase M23-like protein [Compostimonas suwonensis]